MKKYAEINTDKIKNISLTTNLFEGRNKLVNLKQCKHEITIIVMAYNRLDKVKNCIESVLRYTKEIDYELCLIDNGSTDGTLEYFLAVEYRHKRIIRVTKNLGAFYPLMNIDINSLGDFICYLNDDACMTPHWMHNLITCIKSDPRIGLVAPMYSSPSHDGRYRLVLEEILNANLPVLRVCDVGCGKGCYLRNLLEDTAGKQVRLSCADISEKVMREIPAEVEKRQGSLLQIPYPDETFEIVYVAEALEHAICPENAVKELLRITKSGGEVIIIDKNSRAKGLLEVEEWEQWFDDAFFKKLAAKYGFQLEIRENLPYNGHMQDGLFNGWLLRKQ